MEKKERLEERLPEREILARYGMPGGTLSRWECERTVSAVPFYASADPKPFWHFQKTFPSVMNRMTK